MSVVVDASVAALWFVPKRGSEQADRILGLRLSLIAPDLLLAEVASVLLRHRRQNLMTDTDVKAALDRLAGDVQTVGTRSLVVPAYEIAGRHGGALYDALYLALARREGLPLVTEDAAMRRTARLCQVEIMSMRDAHTRFSEPTG